MTRFSGEYYLHAFSAQGLFGNKRKGRGPKSWTPRSSQVHFGVDESTQHYPQLAFGVRFGMHEDPPIPKDMPFFLVDCDGRIVSKVSTRRPK